MHKRTETPKILPLHEYSLNAKDEVFNKHRGWEVGDTFDCFSGEIYKPTPNEKFEVKLSQNFNFNNFTRDIHSIKDISSAISSCSNMSVGHFSGMNASFESKMKQTYQKYIAEKWRMWTCDFTRHTESIMRLPKPQQKNATHYVQEVVKGGQMYFMSNNYKTADITKRFFKLSVSGRGEANGMGVENENKGQVEYENRSITDEEKCVGFSTVGNFFSCNEDYEEAFADRLQGIPKENLQPIKIILKPLPLPLKDAGHEIQQPVKEEFNHVTETLTNLQILMKMTRVSGIEVDDEMPDSNKKLIEELPDLEKKLKTLLQEELKAIKTVYKSSIPKTDSVILGVLSKQLESGASENLSLRMEYLRKGITRIVLEYHIPRRVREAPLKGNYGKQDYRVAIIGKTGSGKSSLANYIVGQNVFGVSDIGERVTIKFAKERATIDGKKIDVYDTPGFYDKDGENDLAQKELNSAQKDGQVKGFDAFIYVVNYRAANDAKSVFKVIKKKHGGDIKHYTILVFNRVEGRVDNVLQTSKEFREINEDVGYRAIGVRCQDWSILHPDERTETNRKLLQMIQHISAAQGGKRYKTGILAALWGAI